MNRLLLVLALLCCISGYLYSQQAAAATAAAAPGSHRVALTAQPHEAGKRQAPGPPYQDPRWRMISAMLVLRDFALVMVSLGIAAFQLWFIYTELCILFTNIAGSDIYT